MEQTQADPILGSVASSLVGRELLYFGANVIYQLESMGNAITNFADIARADFQQLIAYAYTHDVACDTAKPAVVTITLQNAPAEVYPPFSVCLHVGACRFYNIDFAQRGQQIQLYQGTPRTMKSGTITLDAFGLDSGLGAALKGGTWELFKEFVRGKYQSSYVKLGENAISDSVRVFAQAIQTGTDIAGIVFPYTEFNQQLASPEAKLYKTRTGWDKSINVLFGDDNWAMSIAQEQFAYQIYWLEATFLNYTISSRDELYLGYGATTPVKSTFDKNAPLAPTYTVNSHTAAEMSSLAYAKSFVQTKQFFISGIVTEQQITNYLASLDSINSSTVVASPDGAINVWIKPSNPDNTAFGFVQDYLYQYGVAGTTYNVQAATPVEFHVKLTAIGADGMLMKARAQQIIDEYCAYDNLKIDSPISSAILTQQLQRYGITSVTADVAVENEAVAPAEDHNQYLAATPQINTIKQYDKTGRLIGYDGNGLYYSTIAETIGVAPTYVSALGDFLFVCTKGTTNAENRSWVLKYDIYGSEARFYGVETTNYLQYNKAPVIGKAIDYTPNGNNVYIIDDENRMYEFSGGWFTDDVGSILHNQVVVLPISVTELKGSEEQSVNININQPVAYWGGYVWACNDAASGGLARIPTQNTTNFEQYTAAPLPNPFFILDGTLYVLPSATKGEEGFYIPINSTNLNPVKITAMTASSIPLGSASQEGTALLDAVQVDGFLLSLAGDGTNAYLHKGILNNAGAVWNLSSEVPTVTFDGDNIPTKILAVRNGYIYLSNDTGDTVWVVWPGVPSSVIAYTTKDANTVTQVGNVDYTQGIIYTIPNTVPSYLGYNVAGTINGVSVYPRYQQGN